ncbi:GGDEF domain-containing protein [Bowmanella pacifica]|uniref:diguanylate cyclase n=1 Tax=Bowmanella pacifica TaxID=502051 RepID=A0A918DM49_9ALTE|nr:GGDEF domain-containing protein [Bowmanella pacifica]GGO74853.1 hypothetical protein GCM10010982_38660 [Bowmanella pacifica]
MATLCYYLTALLGMTILSLPPGNITLLWLPAGIGLIMFMQIGLTAGPLVFIASLAANYPSMTASGLDAGVLHTVVAATIDTLASGLAALLVQRHLPQGLCKSWDTVSLLFWACLLPMGLSSLLLCSNLWWGGYISLEQWNYYFQALFLADSLGILLIYPLYLSLRGLVLSQLTWPKFVVLTMLFALLSVVAAFHLLPGALYLCFPLLTFVALRGRPYHLGFALLLCVMALLMMASQDLGPFALADYDTGVVMLMSFVFCIAVVSLAIMLHQQELNEAIRIQAFWREKAIHDDLTGLYNRVHFLRRLDEERLRSERTKAPYVVALMDVDWFKKVNDQHGHLIGDRVLKGLADLMVKQLRQIDVLARIGGEEFALLMPNVSLNQARQALERLRSSLEQEGIQVNGRTYLITLSIGAMQADGAPVEILLQKVDTLLYRAKHHGRNRLEMDVAE